MSGISKPALIDHAVAVGGEDAVVLVNTTDEPIGTCGKLQAHQAGLRHRAVSVFVFDETDRLLLQRRATDKYHSGGLWSNSACGHPRPGELPLHAAARRLRAEMGVDCDLEWQFATTYELAISPSLSEVEYDHVFTARWSGAPEPDAAEVGAWRWLDRDGVDSELRSAPDRFTAWFSVLWPRVRRLAAPSR